MSNAGQVPSKSLSDYENEILMLRSEMEQLQIKLGEAESKLQLNAQQNRTSVVFRAEEDARQVVGRLIKEEDLLRRGPLDPQNLNMGDKEKMIQMQQQKIVSLDETNSRLIEELNRLGEKIEFKTKWKWVIGTSKNPACKFFRRKCFNFSVCDNKPTKSFSCRRGKWIRTRRCYNYNFN